MGVTSLQPGGPQDNGYKASNIIPGPHSARKGRGGPPSHVPEPSVPNYNRSKQRCRQI